MKMFKTSCAFIALFTLAGFTGEQSTKDRRKQKINYWGTLTKYTGPKKEYHINNISLARVTEQIAVFESPGIPAGPLQKDPRKGTIVHLDLKEIAKIEVPEPEKTWTFRRGDRAETKEYIEIVVTPRGGGKPNSYMIDLSRRLYCDEKSTGGPIEMDVPLNEIRELVIEGFNTRMDETNGNGDKAPVGCYVCPAVPVTTPEQASAPTTTIEKTVTIEQTSPAQQ